MATDEQLVSAFTAMDKNGDGVLTRDEIKCFMQKNNYNPQFLEKFMATFDINADGKVTLDEYKKKLGCIPCGERGYCAWHTLFHELDKNNSGFIEASEVPALLERCQKGSSSGMGPQKLKEWIAKHDADKDGKISYKEFLEYIRTTQ